jgi:hypothetical protein
MSEDNSLNLDQLDLTNFDINDMNLNESIDESFKNIIYSYPFYSDDNYDYEFRVTFENNNLILDEIKYDDNSDFDECIKIVANVLTKPIEKIMILINDNIDIRDEKTKLTNDIVSIINKSNPNFDLELENNKKAILLELYKDIKDILV